MRGGLLFMNIGEALNQWIKTQCEEDRVRKVLARTSTEELTRVWDDWDGVSLMMPSGEYVGEWSVLIELRQRGVDRTI